MGQLHAVGLIYIYYLWIKVGLLYALIFISSLFLKAMIKIVNNLLKCFKKLQTNKQINKNP